MYSVEIVVPENAESDHAGETVEVRVDEDDYVLAAARRQGLWLTADCQQGWCTTCAAELLDGEVDQSDAKRYYERDEDVDMILPCTAKPRSDLKIRAVQHCEMLEHRAGNDDPPDPSKLG